MAPSAPLAQPSELFRVSRNDAGPGPPGLLSVDDVRSIMATGVAAGIAASRTAETVFKCRNQTQVVMGEAVTPSYFGVLQVEGLLGRGLTGADTLAEEGAVVSEGLAKRCFAVPDAALGQPVQIAGRDFTIVGIAPASFGGIWAPSFRLINFWVPLDAMKAHWFPGYSVPRFEDPDYPLLVAVARVPRKFQPSLQNALRGLSEILEKEYPSRMALPRAFEATPIGQILVSPNAAPLVRDAMAGVRVGVFGLIVVLLGNVGVMFMREVRSITADFTTRRVLGAGHWHLSRLLLLATLPLLLLTFPLTIAIATSVARLLSRLYGDRLIGITDLAVDLRDVAFFWAAFVGAAAVGSAYGLVGAAGTRPLLRRAPATTGRSVRLGCAAITTALSAVLLTLAVTMYRQMSEIPQPSPDVRWSQIHIAGMDFDLLHDRSPDSMWGMRIRDEISRQPGVVSVGWVENLGLNLGPFRKQLIRSVSIDDPSVPASTRRLAVVDGVTSGWLQALDGRLTEGRDFTPAEYESPARTAIISRTAAATWWPNQGAVGKTVWIRMDPADTTSVRSVVPVEIVGECNDWFTHAEKAWAAAPPLFLPISARGLTQGYLVVRHNLNSQVAAASVQRTVAGLMPTPPLRASGTMPELTRPKLAPFLAVQSLFWALSCCSVVVALIGTITLISDELIRRRRELGIRIALGATPGQLTRTLLREHFVGLALSAVSTTVLLYWSSTLLRRFVSATLFGGPVQTQSVLGGAVTIWSSIALIGLAVSAIAARRIAKLDPMRVLREVDG